MRYKIVRYFRDLCQPNEVILEGLTREQAEEHCQSDESSSFTATSTLAHELTARKGEWFDGFTAE